MKLLMTYSEQFLENIQYAIQTCGSQNQSIEEVITFCSSAAEEKKCREAYYRGVAIEGSIQQQSEGVKEFLIANVKDQDRIIVFLPKYARPLQTILIQVCSSRFQKQTSFLAEREKTLLPFIESNQQPHHSRIEQHMRELIYSGNYRSALNLVKDMRNNELKQLIRFGEQLFRLDFSFQMSQGEIPPIDLLVNCLTEHAIVDGEEIAYLQELKGAEEGRQKAFLFLLHNYAEFLYEQKDIIDFIVLYYRIAEESVLFALGWDVNDQSRFTKRTGAKYMLDFPNWPLTKHYHRYEQALRQYIRGLEEQKKVKIRTDKQVGFDRLTPGEVYFAEVYLFFRNKAIQECLDFRHEGVSGHGFADLTKAEIENICGGKTPLQLLEPLLQQHGLLPEYSIFQILNKAILALMAREKEVQLQGT